MKIIVRTSFSNAPLHGTRIAKKILGNPENRAQWLKELKGVTDRMNRMRAELKAALIKNGTKGNWDHVTTQTGMFSYLGLTPEQADKIIEKHHIYMMRSSRISISGLKNTNIQYVADAIKDVVNN